MRRPLASLGLALLAVAPLAAQVELKPGTRVRVVASALGPDPVETTLVRMAGDSLVLQSRSWLPDLAVAPADITRLEVAGGRHNRRNTLVGYGVGTGFGVGALLGLSVGSYVFHQNLDQPSNEFGRALLGGLVGAGAGALVGVALGSASSETVWTAVDQRQVRLALRSTFGAGVGLGLRLTFR